MTQDAVPPPSSPTERIESIDALRGITILVMLFVNDVAGVTGAPAWMKHVSPPDADGMTFVDVVFPAFFFIVGMAIPFSIGRRLERGESLWQTGRHILIRVLGLLVIGMLMVNTESISDDGLLHPHLWILLIRKTFRCVSGGNSLFPRIQYPGWGEEVALVCDVRLSV